MKNYTITVNGTVYDVQVEEGASTGAAPVAAPAAPKKAPAAAPKAAPAAAASSGSAAVSSANTGVADEATAVNASNDASRDLRNLFSFIDLPFPSIFLDRSGIT